MKLCSSSQIWQYSSSVMLIQNQNSHKTQQKNHTGTLLQQKRSQESQLFFHLLLFPKPCTPPAASKLAPKASEPQWHWHFLPQQHQVHSACMQGVSQKWKRDTSLLSDQAVPQFLGGLFLPVHFNVNLPHIGHNEGKHLKSYQKLHGPYSTCVTPLKHMVSQQAKTWHKKWEKGPFPD